MKVTITPLLLILILAACGSGEPQPVQREPQPMPDPFAHFELTIPESLYPIPDENDYHETLSELGIGQERPSSPGIEETPHGPFFGACEEIPTPVPEDAGVDAHFQATVENLQPKMGPCVSHHQAVTRG